MSYWIYSHDDDGEIVVDLGSTHTHDFDEALAIALNLMSDSDRFAQHHILRIVDENNEGQTCWIAGPVEYMREHYER
jgi:hypothetical protein